MTMKYTMQQAINRMWIHFLNGLTLAPVKAIIIYMILNLLDIYITWLVTPDLKYEVNWMVLLFGFGWKFMLWRELIINSTLIIGLVFSMSIIQQHYRNNPHSGKCVAREIIGSIKLFICGFIMISLYIDLFYSILLIVPSNYLQYLYVNKIHNFWTGLSDLYVEHLIAPHPWFTRLIYPLYAVTGILYTLYAIRRIKMNETRNMELASASQ